MDICGNAVQNSRVICSENENNNIDLINLDVEGYELNVIRGLQNILKFQKVTHLFIEIVERHLNKAGTSAKEICDFIESYNYETFSIKSGKQKPYKPGSDESLVYFKSSVKEDILKKKKSEQKIKSEAY